METKTLTTKEFEAIYHEYYEKIFTHISIRVKNREQAEELTSDVFIKVHRFYSMYDASRGQFNTWLYNIARNCVIDYWRVKKLEFADIHLFTDEKETYNVVDEMINHHVVLYDNPYDIIVRKQDNENVLTRMSKLPAKLREVATLFFNEQLSHDEISNLLDMPLGTVKGYIYRAREILKEQLAYA